MNKKVVVNGRFLGRAVTGVDRFAIETLMALDDIFANTPDAANGLEVAVLVPKGTAHKLNLRHMAIREVGNFHGQAWEQFDLPFAAGNDLLINFCNTAPLLRKNQSVVIHDAATSRAPTSYSAAFRAWYSVMIPTIYRRSASICTVSKFSKGDLAALYGARPDVVVLPEGTDHMERTHSDTGVLERLGLANRPYVLAVSSLAPHKNFEAVVRAAELMGDVDFDIAIAGGQNPAVFAAAGSKLSSAVKYAGYVTDAELKALYEGARCFVFPSIYEGYGLPPTEAMACGCAVVASQAAAIPEICGDAALFFDPHDPADLTRVLREFMSNQLLQSEMRTRGLTKAATMRWHNTATILLDEIKRIA